MITSEFDKIVERRLGLTRRVLVGKALEYAKDGDRLHNFNKAASIQGITPKQAAWNFFIKHFVSVQDMIESDKRYTKEMWDEKLGDMINYLILIEALIEDEGV